MLNSLYSGRLLAALFATFLLVACRASPLPTPTGDPTPALVRLTPSPAVATVTSSALPLAPTRRPTATMTRVGHCALEAAVYTWEDRDGNGMPSGDEPALVGVWVEVVMLPQAFIGRQATDYQGKTNFFATTACPFLQIVVTATAPEGYRPTTPAEVVGTGGIGVRFGFRRAE